uniref:Uncharacterized protein n=1 Tax=Lygus hesperus TaxID=30085 RepID=A0A0A9W979_LYGHE
MSFSAQNLLLLLFRCECAPKTRWLQKKICSPPSKTCCDQSSKPVGSGCCEKQNDHCCKKQVSPCSRKSPKPHKCCGKKHDSDREIAMKCCPCCDTMVPLCGSHDCCAKERRGYSSSKHTVKKSRSSEKKMRHTGEKLMRKSTSSEREVEHHPKKSPKKPTSPQKEVDSDSGKTSKKSTSSEREVHPNTTTETSHDKKKRGERKPDTNSKHTKKPTVHLVDPETKDHKNVYVAKRVSSLEESEVYGKYWYHRPPLENVITHCDEDFYEYMPSVTENQPPVQVKEERHSTEKEPKSKNAGLCVGCKEPMCLICKNFICNCECGRPNFVICNLCRHKMAPKKKKVCPPPPPQQIRQVDTVQNGVTDGDAMFLLPILASMQANANCQSCNC